MDMLLIMLLVLIIGIDCMVFIVLVNCCCGVSCCYMLTYLQFFCITLASYSLAGVMSESMPLSLILLAAHRQLYGAVSAMCCCSVRIFQ